MTPTIVLLLCSVTQAPADTAPAEAKALRDKAHALYLTEAKGYTIYREASRGDFLELKPDPVYTWTNPINGGGQYGEVFLWTCRGRSEAVATIFSYPLIGERHLNHELHSLAVTTLDVVRPGLHSWTPEAPGVDLKPIEGAPTPGRTATLRLVQMRTLTREFSGSTEDNKGERWQLRLLPQPLYRYESTDPKVLDGALFAYVTSAGTDPEAFLVIEARADTPEARATWRYGLARFTDMRLTVKHRGTEVFSAPLIAEHDTPRQDAKHRYRLFHDRLIPALESNAKSTASESKPAIPLSTGVKP